MKKNVKNAAAIVLLAGFAALVFGCATPFTHGINAMRDGNYELAIEMFTESVSTRADRSNWAFAYYHRGTAHMRIGEYDRAIADFQESLRSGPSDIGVAFRNRTRNNLAVAQQRRLAQVAVLQQPAPVQGVAQAPATGQQQQPQVLTIIPASVQSNEADFRVEMNRDGTGLVLLQYTGRSTVVHIPATIQGFPILEIGRTAFHRPTGPATITRIVVPEGVRIIRGEAFIGAQAGYLNSITLPEGLTHIGARAFRRTGITSITIPNSVIYLGAGAFSGTRITSFNWPARFTTIGAEMFSNTPLQNVVIPEGVTVIGTSAFEGTRLTSISLPSSIRTIHPDAFRGTRSLTAVNIPASVTSIHFAPHIGRHRGAFYGTSLDFPTQARLRQLGYTGPF